MSNPFNKIGITGLLLILTAITSAAEYGVIVPPDAQPGDLNLVPCEIYLEGDDRHYPGECGTLIVPENRRNPESRLIALPVERIKATGSGMSPEPIFWFEGGPGSSNKNLYPTDGLIERHDFVMVGYRGIDGQVILRCPGVGDAIRNLDGNYLSDTALAVYGRSVEGCVEKLRAEGIDLDGYSMNQTIDDMESARMALGYDRINLFGNSYGTRVEMLYQWRYPNSIHRVVMVAVNPPGHFIWEPEVSDEQIEVYAGLCAKDAYCRSRTSDLTKTMKDLSRNMPSSWMGISIDVDAVRFITFASLMESMQPPGESIPLNGPAAIDMWLDAAEGDASGMALISLLTPMLLPSLGARPHVLAMGGSAADYYDPERDYKAELTRTDTIIGAPFSLFLWGLIQGWPASSDQSVAEVQDSDIETLLISGTIDFSTPMRFARDKLLPHLSNGHHVIVKDQGHTETFWNSQPEARARLLNTFFDTGKVDDSLFQYQAPVFEVDKSWGGIAKTLLGLVVLVFSVFVLLGWVIIRKIRQSVILKRTAKMSSITQG